ncbi:peroxide stress protein YaaA, partial [Francisella tularensis subsp. holarctica]|uniref:peroxide stress protein YaaA n=1 Tax=Francisella tularensis TaxID=263 RepID=UPI002381CBB7
CQDKITTQLNEFFSQQQNKLLLNLASNEYSQAIDKKSLAVKWLDIDLKENKAGAYKTIGIHAKKARGLMTIYILENRIENVSDIKKFKVAGNQINPDYYDENLLCFT